MFAAGGSGCLGFFHGPQYILAQHVEFQIYAVAGLELMEVGVVVGIGNDGYHKSIVVAGESGKADAIDADGTFFHEQLAE